MSDRQSQNQVDVAVVGAGAAGQLAAIAAAEEGRRVVLLEQMPQPGLKILASGGGRCNLTNLLEPAVIASAFGRQGRFIVPALATMGPAALRALLGRLGVPTVVMEGSRVYPASERAADVQAALRRRTDELRVRLCLERAVTGLSVEARRLAGVVCSDGERIAARRVVLACGGLSWPRLGGTGGGYLLARQAGHTIVDPVPALVPLVTRERWPARLAGVSLPGTRLWIALPGQGKAGVTGDMLFTHRGLSGPAVLDISGSVSRLLSRGRAVPVRIQLVGGVDAATWSRRIDGWRQTAGRRSVANLLGEHLPASLSRFLCNLAGLEERQTAAHLPRPARDALAKLLGGLELTVTATEGIESAFVTRGGVRLPEVDAGTLQSRRLSNLYLAGELLDLDGPSGGFNLQWAFASGWLAGRSAAWASDRPR